MSEDKTPAQARGAIQSGESGDIRPGFDPAAAPMETDAEAGGQPSPVAKTGSLPHGRSETDQRNYDVAMREPGTGKTTSQTGRITPVAIVVVALIVIALSLAVASWLGSFGGIK